MVSQRVAVVTDSAAALTPAQVTRHQIKVVPLRLRIDGVEYQEDVNISAPKVVAELVAGKRIEVLEPSAADLATAYAQLAAGGATGIVSIHIAAKMHDVAGRAREAAATSGVPVRVVDSGTVAFAQGLVAMAAAAIAAGGAAIEDVERVAASTAAGAKLMFTADTMDYLHRDGQMRWIEKTLCQVTDVHPLLEVVAGEVQVGQKVRGTAEARAALKASMTAYASTLRHPAIVVSLVGASAAEQGLLIDMPGALPEGTPGASLTAHSGPGTYVVAAADMPDAFTA